MAKTAKQEIEEFLESNEAGMRSQFKKNALTSAATSIFTANGIDCPIKVIEVKGYTYLINRRIVNANN